MLKNSITLLNLKVKKSSYKEYRTRHVKHRVLINSHLCADITGLWATAVKATHKAQLPQMSGSERKNQLSGQAYTVVDKTDEEVFHGRILTEARYRDEILDPYSRPYVGANGDGFTLMDDKFSLSSGHLCQRIFGGEVFGVIELFSSISRPQPY
ncbi:hypothetical protein AVEN_191118-1 [Araneus ventricosus]|uniref:Uncharacterized protein n=1 Tax=Araneus ventricosus TaxID=182803 RepID=A0A4Y2AX76_ARAVE|nr:hypothetical protein AVEN_191118-1 [Araneus ventricosus]